MITISEVRTRDTYRGERLRKYHEWLNKEREKDLTITTKEK